VTQLVEGGRPLLRFRLLGFPVTIDTSFAVVVALLGYLSSATVQGTVIWLAVVPFAVLVHELGHAVAARSTGARPSILLAGLGGVTSYVPPRPLSRTRSIVISLAGPGVGLAIGAALLVYARQVGTGSDLAGDVLTVAVFTTLGWSILNLLPVLPLDGGQTMRELLPGSPRVRTVRAAAVSVVVGVAVAVLALVYSYVFGAVLAGFLALTNVLTVRTALRDRRLDLTQRLGQLLAAGRHDEAREVLSGEPDDVVVHPLVRAAVRQDWPAAVAAVDGAGSPPAEPAMVLAAQRAALDGGAPEPAARIGESFLRRLDGVVPVGADGRLREAGSVAAYLAARGWSRAGDADRAMAAFRRSADLGLEDLTAVDTDPDLAPLRPRPEYDEARQLVRRRALARLEQQEREAGTDG
jgi:Zn-dependent protease